MPRAMSSGETMNAPTRRARIAFGAAFLLAASTLLAAPAAADDATVQVSILRGSLDFYSGESWSGQLEVYNAAGGGAGPAAVEPFELGGGLGGQVSLELPPGDWRIRAVEESGTSGWLDSGTDGDLGGMISLYGWHDTVTFANAATVHVDAAGNATSPSVVIMTHPAQTRTVGGVVGRWSNGTWDTEALFDPETEHVFVELYEAGGSEPVDTYRPAPGSGLYQFFDVAPGTYELRALVGTADPGAEVSGIGDITVHTDNWHPGVGSRVDTVPLTIGADGHWVAANFAIDDPALLADGDAVISGDLYEGGLVSATRTSGFFLDWDERLNPVERCDWTLGDVPVDGVTSCALVLPAGSAGAEVRVQIISNFLPAGIRIVNPGEAGPVAAATAGVITAPIPTVGGQPILGKTLNAQPGTWTPNAPKTFQWHRDGSPIDGATAKQYTIVEDDLGTDLTVTVSGGRNGYMPATRTSAPVSVDLAAFANAPVPVIRGAARYNEELTIGGGNWRPQPVDVAYQWYRDGAAIPGAVDPTYVLGLDDIGATITVSATGSKSGYATVSQFSAAVGPVQPGRIVAPRPDLIGTAQSGQTLSIDTSAWTPVGIDIAYRWQRNGGGSGYQDIAGATGATYVLGSADVGRRVRLVVDVSLEGYTPVQRTTAPTAPIVP